MTLRFVVGNVIGQSIVTSRVVSLEIPVENLRKFIPVFPEISLGSY